MTDRQLVKKLSEVMKEVKYIEKKGYNSFHKYKYATESDVAEKVREVLAEKNVMMIPNMTTHSVREHINAKGKTEYIVTVDMEFRFLDGDTGEEITFNMAGEGQDAGDKAIYKAMTGAQKYALMKAFMIPTGDDPEADNGVDERNNGTQQQESKKNILMAKWKTLEYPEDKFEDWYKGQIEKNYNEIQMERYLTTKLMEKQKQGA
jgi:hypothetical protein